uniref:centrosomal protein of 170 kDa-like isoform X2 n=1 Tax=Panthera onca TaxID=9690 RepID=UPI0029552E80|nr:centrosomal protein of 170 kDa-like isoform X2 [Panthera onca]
MPTSSSFKHRIKEQEDYIRDWTAHREEIARISQDLALIAREINDVAGEIDSVTSSGTAPSTTVSTAATTPGSAIDTREELVDRVFDESLNFRKIPPLVHSKTPEGNNGRSNDPRPQPTEPPDHLTITRRRTWSRDEVSKPQTLTNVRGNMSCCGKRRNCSINGAGEKSACPYE